MLNAQSSEAVKIRVKQFIIEGCSNAPLQREVSREGMGGKKQTFVAAQRGIGETA